MTKIISIISGLLSAVSVAVLSFFLHSCSVARIEAKHSREIIRITESKEKECDDQKEISKKTSEKLQNDLAFSNRKLADYKRLYGSAGTVKLQPSSSTSGYDGAAPTDQLYRSDGVPASELLEFSAIAEETRLKLNACQQFIKDAWQHADN